MQKPIICILLNTINNSVHSLFSHSPLRNPTDNRSLVTTFPISADLALPRTSRGNMTTTIIPIALPYRSYTAPGEDGSALSQVTEVLRTFFTNRQSDTNWARELRSIAGLPSLAGRSQFTHADLPALGTALSKRDSASLGNLAVHFKEYWDNTGLGGSGDASDVPERDKIARRALTSALSTLDHASGYSLDPNEVDAVDSSDMTSRGSKGIRFLLSPGGLGRDDVLDVCGTIGGPSVIGQYYSFPSKSENAKDDPDTAKWWATVPESTSMLGPSNCDSIQKNMQVLANACDPAPLFKRWAPDTGLWAPVQTAWTRTMFGSAIDRAKSLFTGTDASNISAKWAEEYRQEVNHHRRQWGVAIDTHSTASIYDSVVGGVYGKLFGLKAEEAWRRKNEEQILPSKVRSWGRNTEVTEPDTVTPIDVDPGAMSMRPDVADSVMEMIQTYWEAKQKLEKEAEQRKADAQRRQEAAARTTETTSAA